MNKKLIALAVAAFATTGANAANIYDDGMTSLNLKGEIDVYLSASELEGSATSDFKTDPDLDTWAKIQIDADHKLSDSVTVFGSFEIENGGGFGPGDNDANDVSTDDVYFGAMFSDNLGVAVGEIGDFGDSLDAIIIDNTNEGVGYVDDVAGRFESKGHAISLKYTTGGLKLIADTYLAQTDGEDAVFGVSASYDIAGANLGVSYQDRGNRGSYSAVNTGDNDVVGVKLGYGIADFNIATHYVVEQVNSVDYEVFGVAADYTIDAARLYASAYTAEEDNNTNDVTTYTLGADYTFSKNLTGFVEYSAADDQGHEKDAEYDLMVAGVYYTF